ncbi:MAG TPA: hypothetical protein VMV74_11480, partial [Bacteroidales bacterium]|nr:hypothetical protein [Bacteroidales bacterium]
PSGPAEEQIRDNASILARDDSIRQSYARTWMENISVGEIAAETGLDSARLYQVLNTSLGNYRSIISFLIRSGDDSALALRLLETISEKDLRDTPADILMDHITCAPENINGFETGFYDEWVLSPRVADEILSPFRSQMKAAFPDELAGKFVADPEEISRWIESSVTVDDAENYYRTPLTPSGVEKLRISDHHSRDIFFVSLCRTAGHPSRLEPGTGRPQYFRDGKWCDLWFSDAVKSSAGKSFVTFSSEETNPKPEYHIHFTLARFENGRYQTLEFGENVRISDMQKNIPLDPGRYMLVTGNRNENGDVLAGLNFFELLPNDSTTIKVILRHEMEGPRIKGKIDISQTVTLLDGGKIQLSSVREKGIVILWIDPGTEPTRHIFRDLPLLKKEFDEWGGYLLFMLYQGSDNDSFNPSEIAGLPQNAFFCRDKGHEFLKSLFPSEYSDLNFPVVIYGDSSGNILFASEGYRIGIGEQILKIIQ